MNKKNQFVIMLIMVMVFSYSVYVFATPPASPYAPGITLDPACAPGDPNCTIHPPLTTTLTSTTTITMDNYPLNFDSGTLYVDSLNNMVGIGTSTPNNLLQVAGLINFDNSLFNTFLGYQSGYNTTTGYNNTFLGYLSGNLNTIGDNNVFIGYKAGQNGAGTNRSTFIGRYAGMGSLDSSKNVFVGGYSGYNNQHGGENAFFGDYSGEDNVGEYSTFLGSKAGENSIGSSLAFVGWGAGRTNVYGIGDTAIGFSSLYSLNPNYNAGGVITAIADAGGGQVTVTSAAHGLSEGSMVVITGTASYNGQYTTFNVTNDTFNIYEAFVSSQTGNWYVLTETNNTALGYQTGYEITSGMNNILFGYKAGNNLTTGSNNIILGYDIDAPAIDSSNTLNIGNLIFGTGIDGTGNTLSSGNIGIGTTSPYAKLSVVGETVSSYFTATSTATSTFAWGIETNLLNITSSTATSTFANGIDLSGGCFAINGTCVGGGGGSQWTTTGSDIYYNTGKVGIGVNPPTIALEIMKDEGQTSGAHSLLGLERTTTGPNVGGLRLGYYSDGANDTGGFISSIGGLPLVLSTQGGSAKAITVGNNGNVGIGTENPETRLEVSNGAICVDSGIDTNCTSTGTAGDIYYGTAHANWTDIAERYPSINQLEPGDIISLDTISIINGDLKKPYIKKAKEGETLLGAISTKPGLILGDDYGKSEDPAVALSGRIPVKVNLEGGEIKPGDRISLSSKSGVGKKSSNFENSIGIALEGYNKQEEGKILVFINLFYKDISLMQNTLQKTANSFQWILDQFRNMGMFINNGILQVKEIVADKITAKEIITDKVITKSFEIEDSVTGEIYCTKLVNGEWEKAKGKCEEETPE